MSAATLFSMVLLDGGGRMRLPLVILLCASPWMALASPYQAAEVTTAAQAQPLVAICFPGFPGKSDLDARIKACTALIESNPEDKYIKAFAYMYRGAWYRRKWPEKAIADFTESIKELTALEDNTGISLQAYDYRSDTFERMGLHQQAVSDFKKLIESAPKEMDVESQYIIALSNIDPSSAQPYISRAWLHYMMGENARALPDAERAVALAPENSWVRTVRAKIYQQLGRRDDAIADYRMALKLKPDSPLVKEELKRLGVAP